MTGTRISPVRTVAIVACILAAVGCATPRSRVSSPDEYRKAGADPRIRRNLEQGEERLRAGDNRAAVHALNRAVWDMELLERRALRLAELSEVYQLMARAYVGLQRPRWAEEQRQVAAALREAATRDARGTWVQAMTRARTAYVGAQFQDALVGWRDALVDLEDVHDIVTRVKQIEVVRCYLALTHFALGDEDRVREEVERLVVLDASVKTCGREAPPSVRLLISDVQRARGGVN